KVLHDSHARDEAAAARFAQEAQLLEGLSHENLVRVYGHVTIEGARVLLMELVEGPTLADRVAREAPMTPESVRSVGRGIAAGLAHAHGAGIVHRDLKPSNVLLAGGQIPKIADFGMARASSLAGVDPGALTVLGTPDYMAPECLDPLAVDARADLYALGCILFEMLTGHPPFAAATPLGILEAHRDAPIPALPPRVPAALGTLVTSLLAKAPGDRPQAAEAVADALEAMDTGALALQPAAGSAVAVGPRDRCVSCGAPLVVALGVCTDCGHEIAHIVAGDHTVLVTGPGKPGDKLDATLRERLRRWLEETPSLGLVPRANLTAKIPRVPFALTGRVSARSGETIARALKRLGMEASVVQGGPLSSKPMRAKSKTLVGRAAIIVLSCTGGLWNTGWIAGFLAGGLVIATGTMLVGANRRVTRDARATERALPDAVAEALDRARQGLPAITERRHRQGLRGVLTRVVDLARDVPPDDPDAADELARAADAALVAAGRLDALDRQLASLDRDAASQDARDVLHDRDTWASRLLSLTATLDTLAMRKAAAGARQGQADDDQRLERLRTQVEALEEVQAP
nr:serine/threonine protein kinase [Deltaproteobacteria bacterium]